MPAELLEFEFDSSSFDELFEFEFDELLEFEFEELLEFEFDELLELEFDELLPANCCNASSGASAVPGSTGDAVCCVRRMLLMPPVSIASGAVAACAAPAHRDAGHGRDCKGEYRTNLHDAVSVLGSPHGCDGRGHFPTTTENDVETAH